MERLSNGEKRSLLPNAQKALELVGTTSGGTTTVPAPGAGLALQVTGYYIRLLKYAAGVPSVRGDLAFLTSAQQIWIGSALQPAVDTEYEVYLNGLSIQGNENEALTLTNGAVSGGTPPVTIINVYYRTVVV